MFRSYWLSLRLIADDVLRLYKNFFHWNLSKLAIILVTFLTSAVLSLPLLGLAWWLVSGMVNGLGGEAIQDLVSGTLSESLMSALLGNYWLLIVMLLCALAVFAIFTSLMTYGYYLTTRVYQSYIDGERLSVLKNDYFRLPMIWKFLGVLGWSSLYLMIPIAYALIGLGLLEFLTTGSKILTSEMIIGGIAVGGSVLFFGYLAVMAIRIMFSYMAMLEKDALEVPSRELVRRSMRLASGNIPRIIALFLPFVIITFLFGSTLQSVKNFRDIRVLESKANDAVLADKNAYVNDHAFIQREFIAGKELTPEQKQEVLSINNAYDVRTDGIDREYLLAIYPYIVLSGTMDDAADIAWTIVFALLPFFLFDGVMVMVYLSIYHILKETGGATGRGMENSEGGDGAMAGPDSVPKKPKAKKPLMATADSDFAQIEMKLAENAPEMESAEKPLGKSKATAKKIPKNTSPAKKPATKAKEKAKAKG